MAKSTAATAAKSTAVSGPRGALKLRTLNEDALTLERVNRAIRERSVERNSNSSSRRGLMENATLEMESVQVLNKGLQASTESIGLGGSSFDIRLLKPQTPQADLFKDKPSIASAMIGSDNGGEQPSGVGGAGAWAEGAPKPNPNVGKGFIPMQPLFDNIDNPTNLELDTFYQTRSFILIKRSISNSPEDCLSQASFADLRNKPNEFSRMTPELLKTAPKGVHMVYIGVEESIPDSQAKEIIKTVVSNLPKIKDTPPPTGIDDGGNFTTTSRQHIEIVGYYEGKPNLNILLGGLKTILTANSRVATFLDCRAPKKISQQLQFDGVLGLYQNDIIASVEATTGPSIKVSNFHFSPNRFSKSSIITTSAACRMTITHHEGVQIPTTFTVPSWAGLDKTITYKRLFQYTNQKSDTPSDQPKESAIPSSESRYKTIMCRQFKQGIDCPYDSKCQYAHGEAELKKNHPANNLTGAGMNEQDPTPPTHKPTPPTHKPTTPPPSPVPTPPTRLQVLTTNTPLTQAVTIRTGQLRFPPLSSIAASLEGSISVVPGITGVPVIDEDPYITVTRRKGSGNSPPCGLLPRPTLSAQTTSPIGLRSSTMDLSRPMPSETFSKSPAHPKEQLVEQQTRLPFGSQDGVSLINIPLYPTIGSTNQ